MVSYLIYLLTRGAFLFLVVPAIFAGAFFGLLKAGFSPRHIEVWGMAVVAGSVVLVGLKPVEFMWVKFRGERPPPELPSWARTALWVGGGGGGLVLGGGAVFGLLAFVSISSWWPSTPGTQRLGRVRVQVESKVEDGLQRLTFLPARGDDADGAQGLEIKGEVLALTVRTMRFTGRAQQVVRAVGLDDVVRPYLVLTKVDESLEASQKSGFLIPPPLYLSERVLRLMAMLPGVEAAEYTTPFRATRGGFEVDLNVQSGGATLTLARGPVPAKLDAPEPLPPTPTPTPSRPSPAIPSVEPDEPDDPMDFPDGDDPDPPTVTEVPAPTVAPPVVPTPQPQAPSPAEMALLRLGDPFEGL